MAKRLPLTRRLELALESCSSTSEQKIVYGKLAKFVDEYFEQNKSPETFYQELRPETLSPEPNVSYDRETVEKGKSLCKFLQQSVTLPEQQETAKYRKKMIKAMDYEFDCLGKFQGE